MDTTTKDIRKGDQIKVNERFIRRYGWANADNQEWLEPGTYDVTFAWVGLFVINGATYLNRNALARAIRDGKAEHIPATN